MSHDCGTLILRSDASIAMGSGHVMRCLALAQAWQDAGGKAVFATAGIQPVIRERLVCEGIEVVSLEVRPGCHEDASCITQLARAHAAKWVVVDGYHFDADYQRALKAAELKVLFVDDNGHANHYSADLILNQNAYADAGLYPNVEPYTRILLGSRYAMLRREFTIWREWKREIAPVGRKVLVMMGGSDPDNVTARIIAALPLLQLDGLEITLVVGGGNPHFDQLEKAVLQSGRSLRLCRNVSNVPELMAWADVAVSAAGTTCWEMCMLGLPSILIALAENQRPIGQVLGSRGAATFLGSSTEVPAAALAEGLTNLLLSESTRTAMSRRGRELVDGRGAGRVVSAMQFGDFRIRRAEEKDCLLLWEWANDPEVRAVSFSPEPIPWEHHVEWLRSRLASPDAALFLVCDPGGSPVGQVRFQLENDRAVVSICLAPGRRGQGYGNAILKMGLEELFRSTRVVYIDAYVKVDNESSLRLFARAGFKRGPVESVGGQQAVHFVLTRDGS